MRLSNRFFLSCYIFFISFFAILFIFGQNGLIEYYKILDFHDQFSFHVEELVSLNQSLEDDLSLIREDDSELILRARKLGYYKQGEGTILVQNQNAETQMLYSNFLFNSEYFSMKNSASVSLLLASIVGVFFFFVSFLFWGPSYVYQKNRSRLQESSKHIFATE